MTNSRKVKLSLSFIVLFALCGNAWAGTYVFTGIEMTAESGNGAILSVDLTTPSEDVLPVAIILDDGASPDDISYFFDDTPLEVLDTFVSGSGEYMEVILNTVSYDAILGEFEIHLTTSAPDPISILAFETVVFVEDGVEVHATPQLALFVIAILLVAITILSGKRAW